MNAKLPFFLFVFLILTIIPIAYAEDTVPHNLLDIPKGIGDTLGIGEFAAGILTSVILLMVCLLPCMILTIKATGNQGFVFILIVGMSVLGFCVAVAWFPIWFFAIIVLLITLMTANKFREMM
jgi:hypothetical protein